MLQYIATMAKNFKNSNKKCPEKETVRWSDGVIEKLLESVKEFKAQKEYEWTGRVLKISMKTFDLCS